MYMCLYSVIVLKLLFYQFTLLLIKNVVKDKLNGNKKVFLFITGNDKMIPLKDNQDVASFLVTKHSWKGKYKRVFSIGTHGITTYNPDRLEVTNKWVYSDVVTIASAKHSNSAANHDFTLVMKKDKKIDSMKFSSEHKCLILTEAFKYRHLFAEKPKDIYVSNITMKL